MAVDHMCKMTIYLAETDSKHMDKCYVGMGLGCDILHSTQLTLPDSMGRKAACQVKKRHRRGEGRIAHMEPAENRVPTVAMTGGVGPGHVRGYRSPYRPRL